jgi:NitT/TauT family transport system substrate-binding protein
MEQEGIGYTVASVGAALPEVAFSSLAASPAFLATERARRFLRAYRRAREWVRLAPPRDVAGAEAGFFPGIARAALEAAVSRYRTLGCWNGDIGIERELYEHALEVFLSQGAVRLRHPYEGVVVDPAQLI